MRSTQYIIIGISFQILLPFWYEFYQKKLSFPGDDFVQCFKLYFFLCQPGLRGSGSGSESVLFWPKGSRSIKIDGSLRIRIRSPDPQDFYENQETFSILFSELQKICSFLGCFEAHRFSRSLPAIRALLSMSVSFILLIVRNS